MTESQVQKTLLEWCGHALRKDVVYWSTPNEREPKRMGNLRSMGLKKGVSDLMFLREGKLLCIEVKRPTTFKTGKRGKIIDQRGGTLSTAQEEFKNAVTAAGAGFYCVDNLPDFMQILQNWNFAR